MSEPAIPALDEAIVVLRKAVDAVPAVHVTRPGFLNNLGIALRSRFDARAAAAPPPPTRPISARR